ncbi:MAG: zinc ribbon domain-containing protein [Acidimicrobiia bacterium]|nr:zinc ribbon domain-containing protein [Acidimicrobiia bacterium]
MADQHFCTQCGTEVEAGVNFCPSCGTRVEAMASDDTVPHDTVAPPDAHEPEDESAGWWSSLPTGAKALIAAGGGALIVLIVVLVVLLLNNDDGNQAADSTTTTTPGEIFLETAGSLGTDPFTGEVFAEPVVSTTAPAPDLATGGAGEIRTESGGNPGLYGGTRNRAECSQTQLVDFLENNPDKADAFLAALNSDPTLSWSDTTPLRRGDLDDYLEELTPVTLRYDTRVTNHGYRDGRPTPRQTVLQAGTAVFVDAYGVPRVRCECGNPLIPPAPVRSGFTYRGDKWTGFDENRIIVVNTSETIVEKFVLVDLATGDRFERPVGSTGGDDVPVTTSTTTTTTTAPPPPAVTPVNTPEDALADYAYGQGLTYSGDCEFLDPDLDVGTWCSKLLEDLGVERTYLFGEAFTGNGVQLLVGQTETGWAVINVTESNSEGL